MPGGRFDALAIDDGTDSDDETDASKGSASEISTNLREAGPAVGAAGSNDGNNHDRIDIPSYEDLSSSRADEETVLQAIYGDDFHSERGTWGQKKLMVKVRPPDLEPNQIGCEATVSTQLSKRYPYVVPRIELKDVKGLSKDAEKLLLQNLTERASDLASVGSVMVCELVQVVEDFLFEHNVDPTMSAWEQSKAREAKEQAEKGALEREREKRIKSLMDEDGEQSSSNVLYASHSRSAMSPGGSGAVTPRNMAENFLAVPATCDIERELARQREAIETANKQRMNNDAYLNFARASSMGMRNDGDDDDDFDDDDAPPTVLIGSSRYQTDFIELGVLGRGGGGEVVKVRNRLDRRTYAIKKILLESELGKSAKQGETQNRKLRREVTTISRMTHKNIVRYYQAWVEGGADAASLDDVVDNNYKLEGDREDTAELLKDALENVSEDDSDEVEQGWWSKPPNENHSHSILQDKSDIPSKSESSSFDQSSNSSSWSEEEEHIRATANATREEQRLATGMNFDNQIYQSLFKNNRYAMSSSEKVKDEQNRDEDDSSSAWDESSVKVDVSKKQSVLYIQMEYCNTTLRKLIDELAVSQMDHSEIWRLVRQIVEAMVYIHSKEIIHRDLVSCFCAGWPGSLKIRNLVSHLWLALLVSETWKYFP